MLIDTHCHLVDEYVNPADVPGVLARARDAGVGTIIVPCADPTDPSKVIALCEQYDNLFCTIGIHPEYACLPLLEGECHREAMTRGSSPRSATPTAPLKEGGTYLDLNYENYLNHPRVVGIGEIGLDYHYGPNTRDAQIDLFRAQLEIAARHALPVAIHTREAESDTFEILKEFTGGATLSQSRLYERSVWGQNDPTRDKPAPPNPPGVMHCYSSSWDLAKKMLDRGFYFSASGIITFKNAEELRTIFARLPIDRIVIETDAPFLAPVPYRGKKAEPFMVAETARVLADIRGIPLSELENILAENTRRLYPKLKI